MTKSSNNTEAEVSSGVGVVRNTRWQHLTCCFCVLVYFFFMLPQTSKALTTEDLQNYSGAKYEPLQGCYLGAYIDQAYWVDADPLLYNEQIGKDHASFFRYVGYGQPFPEAWVNELAAARAIPQIAWEPNNGLEEVEDNEYLRSFARQAGASGAPIFLRFASEVNGNWTAYTGDPEKYIEKWRLVYRVMQEEAPNVAMVWTVFTNPQSTILRYYPGDNYVDWVGVNVYSVLYYNANPRTPSTLQDPIALLSYVYDLFAERKPIHISEWAVVNYTLADGRHHNEFAATQLRRMYEGIIAEKPRIKAIYYFDANISKTAPPERRIRDYSVSHKEETLSAYQEFVANDFYLSNIKDNVNIEAKINGKKLTFNNLPILQEDEIYISARDLAQALGLHLQWQGGGKLLLGDWELTIDKKQLKGDDIVIQTRRAPVIFQERSYLPLQDLAKHLGYTVELHQHKGGELEHEQQEEK